jgi:hypothetical protein
MGPVLRRLVCWGLLFGLLAGCSAIKLGYGQADSLLHWWIDHYIDMDSAQERRAREVLAGFFAWHRSSQLPAYGIFLRDTQKLLQRQVRAEDTKKLADELTRFARVMAGQALPEVADFLLTLKPEQVRRMEERFAQKNAEFLKEHVQATREEQLKARYKRVLERVEYWYGGFSDEQEKRIRQLTDSLPLNNEYWYRERLRRQQEWLDIARLALREQPDKARLQLLLREFTERFDRSPDEKRRAHFEAMRAASADMTAAIMNLATPDQRAYAQKRLEGWARDFEALSRGE